jgi:glutamate-1-semialdehyde 2,1-aminomutase
MVENNHFLFAEIEQAKASRYKTRVEDKVRSGYAVLNEGFDYVEGALFLDRGEGSYVFDIQGGRYIDFALGAGTLLLGHASPTVVAAVKRRVEGGSLFVRPNLEAHHYAELLASFQPSPKQFAFCNSGAEATMRAMRVARGYSGRTKIAIWPGGWHGSHDWGLFEEDPNSGANLPSLFARSAGIPVDLAQHLVLLPQDVDDCISFVEEHARDLAMVFVEPIRGPLPLPESTAILPALREVTRKQGILLGLDEVVTGFRLALGGGQERYGIDADIVAYGKIAGGGLPIGIVGLTQAVAEKVSANSPSSSDIVYFGGTFSANPLSMAAGFATIQQLANKRETLYPKLDRLTDWFLDRMNGQFVQSGIAMRCVGLSGIFRFLFSDQRISTRRERDMLEASRAIQDLFYDMLLLDGIHVGTNRIMFLSEQHGEEHLTHLASAAERAGGALRDAGLLDR